MTAQQHTGSAPTRRGPGRPVDRTGAESRQLLLDAACRLFAEQGYSATTTRQIAEAAGMQSGNLRHHLGSKAETFTAAYDHSMSVINEMLTDLVRRGPQPTPGGYVREMGRLVDDAPDVLAFLAAAPLERSRHVELRSPLGEAPVALEELVRGAVQLWAANGRVADGIDIEDLADVLIAVVFGVAVYTTRVDGTADRRGVVETLGRLIDGQVWVRN